MYGLQQKQKEAVAVKSDGKEMQFKCELCSKSFSTQQGRSSHLNHCKRKNALHTKDISQTTEISSQMLTGNSINTQSLEHSRSSSHTQCIWGFHTKDD